MAKKTPDEIAIDSFGGSKEVHPFFCTISNEAYKGYCTAMLLIENPKANLSAREWFSVVSNLVDSGKL